MKAKIDIAPTDDRVVIRLEKPPTKSAGGIIMPDSVKEKRTQIGEVLAVGPGVFCPELSKRIRVDLSVGDRILIAMYSGSEIEGDEYKDLVIVRERDVMAVLPTKPVEPVEGKPAKLAK